MAGDDVAFAGLAGQIELVRSGAVSARELVELSLNRIERIDPELNSFAAVYGERALQQADEADARVAKGDFPPLIGIPIAVKDEIDIAGEVTSRGTGAYTTPAPADAEVVRRLRAAGAIVIGKTKMPELGLWPFTESITWGVTRNPWDLERTPGGSSGGSAAAVAAGLVPAALAVDGAGSIRIPAACCGLFGLKPQRNRVPMTPHFANGVQWVVFGTVTRSVLDTGVMLDVLSTQSPGFAQATRTQPGSLRVGVVRGFPLGAPGKLSDEVSGALDRAADLLGSLGHTVAEQKIDLRPQDTAVILGLMFRFIRELVLDVERPQRLERRTRAFARAGALISDAHKGAPAAGPRQARGAPRQTLRRSRRAPDPDDVRARCTRRHHGGARGDGDVFLGERMGAVHDPLERHRSAGGLGARRILVARPAPGGPNRRQTQPRKHAALTCRANRGRTSVVGPTPGGRRDLTPRY